MDSNPKLAGVEAPDETMSLDYLRSQLQASFQNRAVLYYLIFDELRKEVGEQPAIAILKRAIYRRGQQIGQQFSQFGPKDLAGLKDAFLGEPFLTKAGCSTHMSYSATRSRW